MNSVAQVVPSPLVSTASISAICDKDDTKKLACFFAEELMKPYADDKTCRTDIAIFGHKEAGKSFFVQSVLNGPRPRDDKRCYSQNQERYMPIELYGVPIKWVDFRSVSTEFDTFLFYNTLLRFSSRDLSIRNHKCPKTGFYFVEHPSAMELGEARFGVLITGMNPSFYCKIDPIFSYAIKTAKENINNFTHAAKKLLAKVPDLVEDYQHARSMLGAFQKAMAEQTEHATKPFASEDCDKRRVTIFTAGMQDSKQIKAFQGFKAKVKESFPSLA